MVLGGLSSALPEATGPAPCYEPLLPSFPSPPLSLLLQPLFLGKRWERVFIWGAPALLLPIPPWLAQPGPHPPKPSATVPIHPSSRRDLLSVQQEGKGRRKRRRKATENRHHGNSLPASAGSQRAAPPSLLGALTGPSILFFGGDSAR